MGISAAADVRAEALRLERLGVRPFVAQRRAASESSVAWAKSGILTGPISFCRSPLTKKRTCVRSAARVHAISVAMAQMIGVVDGLFKTLNDVRLSSTQEPWLSLTSVQRWCLPVPALCPHDA